MAMVVIQALEMVQVDKGQAQWLLLAQGAGEIAFRDGIERPPVEQIRQFIARRQALRPLLVLPA